MKADHRPDPDSLLRAVQRQEQAAPRGKLHIFFGMAAGAGKTYAMLESAQSRKREGVDVVVGLVETHGRSETESLLLGLEIIPRTQIEYRGVSLAEFDIDAVLKRRPSLVLVDELAHTNVPGSRHPKRWQDIDEILAAGIDVYTTLNVQHLESHKSTVEKITGILIRETVPDAVLDRAAQIVLVDITPAALLQRLREGKIYLGDKATRAIDNFFKEDRLTALRELALRTTAEKVDSDLSDITTNSAGGNWRVAERLLVAISHSPLSEGLIRATRRLASTLDASWLAVRVDTGQPLNAQNSQILARHIQLVHELGGEVVSTADTDIASALDRVARQHGVTQIVIGRPTRRMRDLWSGGTILDQLLRLEPPMSVHVLQHDERDLSRLTPQTRDLDLSTPGRDIIAGIATVVLVAVLSSLLSTIIGYKAVGLLFLLAMLLLSLTLSLGAVLIAAVLSSVVWNYFFIPPVGTFYISDVEDALLVLAYLLAAVVTGTLTARIRKRQRLIRQNEAYSELVYELAKGLVASQSVTEPLVALSGRFAMLLSGDLDVITRTPDGDMAEFSLLQKGWLQSERERAVARWAFEKGQLAGWGTDTLPSATARYLPLQSAAGRSVGVLAYHPSHQQPLTHSQEQLLAAVSHQLALSIERERLRSEVLKTEQARESERLMQTVIDSVSHELRTPLAALSGTASALTQSEVVTDPSRFRELVQELSRMTDRLNRVVGNLLDMSRLSSGLMTLNREWHDPADLISAALRDCQPQLDDRQVVVRAPERLPLLQVDFQLLLHAVTNVILNAAQYAYPATPIGIELIPSGEQLILTIDDDGPGIPPHDLPMIFTKFYRAKGSPAGGVGLGLAIAKGIVEAHCGTIVATNRPGGGARFQLMLPLSPQPTVPIDTGISDFS